ncbi:MAG: SpoIIIAH-like family protein [Clostridia bacterium]|nr:SpoIIIAH-like family protein [Clostridia bacterium]
MKAFLKKKQLMTVALVAALGVAVYLNYYLSSEPGLSAGTDVSAPENSDTLGEATFVGAPVSKPENSDTGKGESSSEKKEPTYFDEARANRTAAREEALSILQEVLDNAQASAEDKAAATEKATAIAENVLQESNIESLITAKGFPDSVVYISGDSCSVVVQTEALQQQESLQILEIVVSQADVSAGKVQIVAAKA